MVKCVVELYMSLHKWKDQRFFYLYHSIEAAIVVLFRKHKRNAVEMIRWDTKTDTFTAGQWLMKKTIDFKNSFLSADGVYFHYIYYTYLSKDKFMEDSYIVQSCIPNFTAEKISKNERGHWNDARSSNDDIAMLDNPFCFIDHNGRTITTDGFIIYANGVQVYDATDHVFQERKPMDIYGNNVEKVEAPMWD
jgi:hypothetical protein